MSISDGYILYLGNLVRCNDKIISFNFLQEIYTTGPDFPKPADPYEKIGYTYGIR